MCSDSFSGDMSHLLAELDNNPSIFLCHSQYIDYRHNKVLSLIYIINILSITLLRLENQQNNTSSPDLSCSSVSLMQRHSLRMFQVTSMTSLNAESARGGQCPFPMLNISILGISELKWMAKGKINPDDHDIYYYGQESLRRNGVALRVNKTVPNSVLRWNLKKDRMISIHFQGKPFNITVIQVCSNH